MKYRAYKNKFQNEKEAKELFQILLFYDELSVVEMPNMQGAVELK